MILLSCVVVVHDRDKTVITIVSRPNNLEDHHQHSLSQDHISQTWINLFFRYFSHPQLALQFNFLLHNSCKICMTNWKTSLLKNMSECKSLFFVIMLWKYIFECKIIIMLLVYIGLKLGVLCKSKRLNIDIYSRKKLFHALVLNIGHPWSYVDDNCHKICIFCTCLPS